MRSRGLPDQGLRSEPGPDPQGLAQMGRPIIKRQRDIGAGLTRSGPLIAFDFDGTLSVNDTFLAFLRWRQGFIGYHMGLALLAPSLLAFLWHRNVERLKAAAIYVFLRGVTLEALEAEAQSFADHAFDRLLRPDALEAWRARQSEGAEVVIVTASPEAVIGPFAKRLRADRLIGTRLALDERGRLTGALDGANCRGAEKVNRLKAAYGPDVQLAAAYGDTDGDVAMLGLALGRYMKVFIGDPRRPAKAA